MCVKFLRRRQFLIYKRRSLQMSHDFWLSQSARPELYNQKRKEHVEAWQKLAAFITANLITKFILDTVK